jgi:hypothetical protein
VNQINNGNLYCLPFWSQLQTQPAQPPSGRIAHLMINSKMEGNTICRRYSGSLSAKRGGQSVRWPVAPVELLLTPKRKATHLPSLI